MKRILFLLSIFSIILMFGQNEDLKVNDLAPEIIQTSINGDDIMLSSLRGKIVLVEFWASWCAPCRKENPHLVEVYEKFKNTTFKNGEGFTIFSVSLDENKNAWQNAIKKDGLVWPYQVCDLKGWRNEAALSYNVNVVPRNFLIDGDGRIIAINLRGNALDDKLKKLSKEDSFWGWFRRE